MTALYYYLNFNQIQARVDHDSGTPFLVKVELDPTGEQVLREDYYFEENLVPHLLPLSNGMRTLRVEMQGEWAMWVEPDEKWIECKAPH